MSDGKVFVESTRRSSPDEMGQSPLPYVLVKRPRQLCQVAAELERETAIAVDLEADSMYHYQEKVCLLQISSPFLNVLVDTLALEDLSALAPIFANRRIKKVFHGADYDIRSLHRDFGIEVHHLFDTQIAARFLGIRETGLAKLAEKKLGVTMEKKYQKKDWSERPLPSGMLHYAVEDVCHLLPLARLLEEDLEARGRLSWVQEESELLSRVRVEETRESFLFLRFKGAGRLDDRSLAVLEAILRFRDQLAMDRNLPPFKVLGNDSVREIAVKKPLTNDDFKTTAGLTPKQIKNLGSGLLKCVKEALSISEQTLPAYPKKRTGRVGVPVKKAFKALKDWRDKRAEELDLDPALVLNKAQIQSLALARPRDPKDLAGVQGLRDWQRQAFGFEICALFRRHHSD